jgi:hypothetical protein
MLAEVGHGHHLHGGHHHQHRCAARSPAWSSTRQLTVGKATRRCGGVGGRSARGQKLWGKW